MLVMNMHTVLSFRDSGQCADRSAESSKYTDIHSVDLAWDICPCLAVQLFKVIKRLILFHFVS